MIAFWVFFGGSIMGGIALWFAIPVRQSHPDDCPYCNGAGDLPCIYWRRPWVACNGTGIAH